MARWSLVAVGLVAAGLSACDAIGWRSLEIEEARVDGLHVTAGSHCHTRGRLQVHELPDRVVVTLQVRGDRRGDCADREEATLRTDLGARALIDGSTGRPVARHARLTRSSPSSTTTLVVSTCLDVSSSPECHSGRR